MSATTKSKTSELQGAALDWAVAKCSGPTMMAFFTRNEYTPSTDWEQGGPIIERERIRLDCPWSPGPYEAVCKMRGVTAWCKGSTVLIAAMRCYCCAKLGEEVEIPEGVTPTVKKSLTVHGARKWVGLTEDEFKQVCWESGGDGITGDREESLRAMEALLKEKNA